MKRMMRMKRMMPNIPIKLTRRLWCDRGRRLKPLGIVSLLYGMVACTAQPYMDEPLDKWSAVGKQQFTQTVRGDRDPEVLVMLALSGGGTRASAFAYGVLQELAATTITTSRGERRLLDEVDVISSVSGGSFTNAYFGLYGDRIFDDFEERFLRVPIQSNLTKGVVGPGHWGELGSKNFGRSDMAAKLYDEKMFDGKTFADLRRPGAPLIIINSTDIATGTRISFSREMFDLICADLDKYPISRAVAASSAVPGMATPITLENYAGSCDYEIPAWLKKPTVSSVSTLGHLEAQSLNAYLDASERRWLHLVDGGISDNLGLRAFYTIFSLEHNPQQVLKELGHERVKQIVIISVNAATHHIPEWAAERRPPKIQHVLGSMTNVLMNRYTGDTTHIVRSAYSHWTQSKDSGLNPITFDFVEVSFAGVKDVQMRQQLNDTVTSLELDDADVDRLIGAGRTVLQDSSDFRAFVTRNSGANTPAH
jgi:NTE family protein